MNKSIFERIFPHSPTSRLPQYHNEYDSPSAPRSPTSPPRIALHDSPSSSHSQKARSISPQDIAKPLSTSLVHYDDPFLPITRASKSLERTFQNLLDAQSEGLLSGIGAEDDASSLGSPTPTPSTATPGSRRDSSIGPKVVPIRQPKTRKLTLRAARKGLIKTMRAFSDLKMQETSLVDKEIEARNRAIQQASVITKQRATLENEISKIQTEDSSPLLKEDIAQVELEITAVENRLSDLRVRHRFLISKLEEQSSTKESKLSSYKESFKLNDAQQRRFLRHPPVTQSLIGSNRASNEGFYALKPERRTLAMATEQWISEVESLQQRRADAENEKLASEEGSQLWQTAVKQITEFEKDLKVQTRELSASQLQTYSGDAHLATIGLKTSMEVVLTKLNTLIQSLQRDLSIAERKGWSLLVVAIGAELAAFEEARNILKQTDGVSNGTDLWREEQDLINGRGFGTDDDHRDAPSLDFLTTVEATDQVGTGNSSKNTSQSRSRSGSMTSNQSLEDTLREFASSNAPVASPRSDLPAERPQTNTLVDDNTAKTRHQKGATSLETSVVRPPQSPLEPSRLVSIGTLEDTALGGKPNGRNPSRTVQRLESEDEDDDPSPDFLVSTHDG